MSVSNGSEHKNADFPHLHNMLVDQMPAEDGMRIVDAEAMTVDSRTCRYLQGKDDFIELQLPSASQVTNLVSMPGSGLIPKEHHHLISSEGKLTGSNQLYTANISKISEALHDDGSFEEGKVGQHLQELTLMQRTSDYNS